MKFHSTIPAVKQNPNWEGFDETSRFRKFRFSKTRIIFTKRQGQQSYCLSRPDWFFYKNNKYLFDKEYDDNEKKQFKITIVGNNGGWTYLKLNWWNKIKCNIIHNRYWIQQEFDWIYKYVISTIIAALIGIYANHRGFNEGYQAGLKAGISKSQKIAPK